MTPVVVSLAKEGTEMDKIIEQIGSFLISQGFLGVALIICLATCYRLFSLYQGAMEQRVEEGKSQTEAIIETRRALERLADLLRAKDGIR